MSVPRKTLRARHGVPAIALIAGCATLGASAPAFAQPKAPAAQQTVEARILERLQELEAQIAESRAETARLRQELAKKTAAPAAAAAAAKSGTGDDWDEPDVAKKPEGRDEEARRRLLLLETQMRKTGAEAAKREEERKGKFEFGISGKYKAQVNDRGNFNLENANQRWTYDDATFFDQRFQLTLDATYESFLTRLTLDQGNFVFDWKEDSQGTLSRWGEFLTVNSALVRELFVQYTGPFMLRVGRQNWDVGHSIALEGPVDGVSLQYPLGPQPWGRTTFDAGYLALGGGWSGYQTFRQTGGPPAGNRNELLGASNQISAYYADLDIRPSRGVQVRPYLLQVRDSGGPTSSDLNLDKDFNPTTNPRDGNFQPLWAGVALSADIEPWTFDAEAISLSGDISRTRKVSASALYARIARSFGKAGPLGEVALGLQFGRGSGNGTTDASLGTLRNFNALFLCRDRHLFGNIFSQDIRAGYFLWDSNLSNITYLRFDATLEPVKGLKATPYVTRIRTTEEVFAGAGPVFDWSTGFGRGASTASTTRTTRDVGWEIGINASYPLLRNVDGFLGLGYFRPGAAYARPDGSNPKRALETVLGAEIRF